MTQISEHINSSNQKIHSYEKMSKMIVNLGSNKCEEKTTPHENLIIFRIRYQSLSLNPEKDLSNVYRKLYMRKVRTSSINSSSKLFSCSILAMYNRVNSAQNKRIMLKSYIYGINTSILPKKHYENLL